MTDRQDRPTTSLATRVRLALSLGIALGLGSVGTMALWSATATAHPGGPVSGQLDLTVNGDLVGTANRDGTRTEAGWTVTDMLPGEQQAISVAIGNNGAGNIPFDFRLSTYAAGALAPALRVTVYDGGTPTNSAPAPNAYRSASCPGGTLVGTTSQVFGTTPSNATAIDGSKQTLAVSQTHTYCVIVTFPDSAATRADAALRDAKATLFFVLKGTQVGAAP